MKRRRSARAPLFRSTEPDVYLIDTSAWIHIDEHRDRDSMWALIDALIERGRIVACAQVLAELRDNPMFIPHLKPYLDALQAGDRNSDDPDYLRYVGRITYEHAGMAKALSWKTRADPYVIALAELERYVVVVGETLARRPNTKIPGVCDMRGILWLPVDEFIECARKSVSEL